MSEEILLSEVHTFADPEAVLSGSKDGIPYQTYLTRFSFAHKTNNLGINELSSNEGKSCNYDEDGDLILSSNYEEPKSFITLEHSMGTQLSDVGKQIWKGSFLMCDYIMDVGRNTFCGKSVLELGAGAGMCGIIAALYAKKLFITDIGQDILSICQRNFNRNSSLIDFNDNGPPQVTIKELNWFDYENVWNYSEDNVKDLKNTDIIIAADVIYDEPLTDAFFATVMTLMKEGTQKTLYVSLEKRLNFTLNELDVCAPAYDYFLSWLDELKSTDNKWKFSRIETNVEKYFDYDRIKDLELWKIEYQLSQPG